jgi:hypothetical protein
MPSYTAPATLLRLRDFDFDFDFDFEDDYEIDDDYGYDIESGNFSVTFASSRFSYEYGSDWGEWSDWDDDIGTLIQVGDNVTPRALSFNGETIMGNGLDVTEVGLFDMSWGAGRETRVLMIAASDFHFEDFDVEDFESIDFGTLEFSSIIMPISGDVLPDLAKGGVALLDEMGMLVDEGAEMRISEGPMAPGRSFDAGLLFADDTSGFAREGGGGRDRLFGKGSDDLLVGNGGRDLLKGKGGDDTMMGGAGKDKLLGGGGNDVLSGWSGNDRLLGQKGNDTLAAGGGNDVLLGQKGNDRMFGDSGNDTLKGGDGRDRLEGGAGDDLLAGGKGRDVLTGGGGADSFVFSRKDGDDTITDFNWRQDALRLNDNLWRADLDAGEVIERFAETTDEGVLFDFGRKGSVLIEDMSIDSISAHVTLAEAIEIF